MAKVITCFVLHFLVFLAMASTSIKAQATQQCDYEMIVNTGITRGPSNSKLRVIVEAIGGEGTINTTNLIRKWGAMGQGYTYFLPYSSDRFRTRLPCMKDNFCWIGIRGKKGELNPHWYIENITVSTKGPGVINRMKTFQFLEEIDTVYPDASHGECP
ncbi:hypothetical protein C5167_005662 [Papaver somniferum]|uniref:PLAT domain-containing protein n=1 Tax=Papaver somniferum TaxID=3469 RepID=A0A4Y7JB73_PAPSO|nr:PLAT domain-containing protein 1-like [Papaver somniferum]RZC58363.1 hypothetical protein C5167_005662 [Papaver somniferum]